VTRLSLCPELRPARAHAGAALAALESAYDAACRTIDPVLADPLRSRVAEHLGGDRPSGTAPPSARREQACFEFADQFVVYVPGISAAQRDAVAAQLGQDQALDLARTLYIFDMTARLRLSLGRLFESAGSDGDDLAPVEEQALAQAVDGLHAAAMQLHALDPVTTELVRLHCARYHDCKT
jgi:alkylhydroperoxidase family enzyme